jgi:hypothetical protein
MRRRAVTLCVMIVSFVSAVVIVCGAAADGLEGAAGQGRRGGG